MWGFIAGAALWGFAKGAALGTRRSTDEPGLGHHALGVLAEELESRYLLENVLLKQSLAIAPSAARAVSSAAFGLLHLGTLPNCAPTVVKMWRVGDAALGGYIYSHAYERHGLLGSALTHLAHNLGVQLSMR